MRLTGLFQLDKPRKHLIGGLQLLRDLDHPIHRVELFCEALTFDIDIPDEEAQKMRTVRDAIVSVEKYRREQPSG